jgi:hypothetical protein
MNVSDLNKLIHQNSTPSSNFQSFRLVTIQNIKVMVMLKQLQASSAVRSQASSLLAPSGITVRMLTRTIPAPVSFEGISKDNDKSS